MKLSVRIKILMSVVACFILGVYFCSRANAQDDSTVQEVKYKAVISELERGFCPEGYEAEECYFLELEILDGYKKGNVVEVVQGIDEKTNIVSLDYKKGMKVYIVETEVVDQVEYYVKEPLRKNSLISLVVVFVFIVVLVGGRQGVSSLLGIVLTYLVLFFIIIPLILSGTSPFWSSILGGTIILVISVYFSHGFNKKSSIALAGTIISISIIAFLSIIYTRVSRLTGFSTDEATYLVQFLDRPIDMRGILLASFVISGLGVLDDITVSQVSTIFELFKANPDYSLKELFLSSMRVGRDHIASMVNTLILAYTGSSLPLIMLFYALGTSLEEIINYEAVAEEIVRTLVGSIGLILAVPITSLLACYFLLKQQQQTPLPLHHRRPVSKRQVVGNR